MWNHRVVRQVHDGEELFGIHECFYNPTGWTENPVAPVAESVEGLRVVLERMLKALDKPVIEDNDGD